MLYSIVPSADTSIFLEIVRVNDVIAGRAVGAVTKFRYLPVSTLPAPVVVSLTAMGKALPEMIHSIVTSIELLEEKIYSAYQLSKEISGFESKFDSLYSNSLHHIFDHEMDYNPESRFTIMLTLKECADAFEEAADLTEHLADMISMLGAKYKP